LSAHGRPDPPRPRGEAGTQRRRRPAATRRILHAVEPVEQPAEPRLRKPGLRAIGARPAEPLPPALPVASPELRGWIVLAAVAAVVIAAAAGWSLRNVAAGEPPASSVSTQLAAAGPASLVVDGDWSKTANVPGLPALDPSKSTAFVPAPGLDAFVVATVGPIDDQTLIPAALRSLLRGPVAAPRPVKLLGGPAWSYPEQWMRDNRRMELSIVPTTAGSVAIACIAPRASWVAATGCAAGVRQISVAGAERVAPEAGLAARARIPAVVAKLDARRVKLRTKLRAAERRRGQARFAKRLSRAYAAAAASLKPVTPAKGPVAKTVAALRAGAGSHRKLSTAAAKGWPKRYRMAKRAVKRDDAALRRALRALR
jgi:hypothetical protein